MWILGNKNMTQLPHIKIQFPTRNISSPDSISKTETSACHLYFILEAKRIEDSCLLTLALVYLLCFIYCVGDLTRLRVYFRAKHRRSSFEIPIFLLLVRQRWRQFLPNETVRAETIGEREREKKEEREREIYRCIARVDRKARRIYFRPAGPYRL